MIGVGFTKITSLTPAAKGLSEGDLGGVPPGTALAVVQVEGGTVRFRDDGTDPTAADGVLLQDGDVLEYDTALADVKFFQASGTPQLNVLLYREPGAAAPSPDGFPPAESPEEAP